MRIFKQILLLIWLTSASWSAEAADSPVVKIIAGRSITFVLPRGFCPIGDGTPQERSWRQLLDRFNAGVNMVVLSFADCQQLARFKNDQDNRIQDYGTYLVSLSPRANYPANYPRAKFLATAPSQLQKIDPTSVEDKANKKFNDLATDLTIDNFSLGMVDANENAVYIVTGALVNAGGQLTRKMAVTAITLAKGVFISIHLYSDYRDQETFLQLLNAQRRLASAFVVANEQ